MMDQHAPEPLADKPGNTLPLEELRPPATRVNASTEPAPSPLNTSFTPETVLTEAKHSPSISPLATDRSSVAGDQPATIGEKISGWWNNLPPIDRAIGAAFTSLGVMESVLLLSNPTGPDAIMHVALMVMDFALAARRLFGTSSHEQKS